MSRMKVIRQLADNGWISLRQLGVLLDLPSRSIYGRQRTKNPVPTVRIGGIERVYTSEVISEVQNAKKMDEGERAVLLSLLRTSQHMTSDEEEEPEDA